LTELAGSVGDAKASTTQGRGSEDSQGLQTWQFFVLAALACSTAVTFIVRGQGVVQVILLTVLMGTAGLIGLAAYRALRPLVSPEDDRTAMVGARTRSALEREKALTLRAIKDLEFDRAMGKLSDGDWTEMSTRLRARATRLIRQLDAGLGYRSQIERDLAKRLGDPGKKAVAASQADVESPSTASADAQPASSLCGTCATLNPPDARFCKECGARL
jgi:hypothetical protein